MPVARNVWQPISVFMPRAGRAAPDHEVHLRLAQSALGELLRFAFRRPEEGSVLLVADARGLDVRGHVLFEIVMRRHFVALAALLMETDPPAAILQVPIFDIHTRRRTHAGEGVDHEPDERAIAETDDGRGVDAVEELPSFIRGEHGCLAAPRTVLRPA